MSVQCDVITSVVSLINAREYIDVERFFTPDFQLDQPGGTTQWGHQGARDMLDAMLGLGGDLQVTIVDMMEDGDRVAVRYQVTSDEAVPPLDGAMLAIYRFVDGRIAKDWGLAVSAPWQS